MATVNIYTEEINDVVKQRGHNCEWQRAAVCHCITSDSGQPNFSCHTCGGSGYRYLPAKKIKVAISSLNSQFDLETLGLREPGTAYVTPTDDVIMGYKDRLRFPDFKCIFSEVIHWNFEDDGRGISHKTYRNIKEVIFLADGDYEFEENVDFEVTEDRHHIRWINQDYISKLDKKNMSLLYYTTPSYLVTDLLHELRATLSDRKTESATFRELPKQYKVNREDFIYGIQKPEPVVNNFDENSGNNEDNDGFNSDLSYDDDGGIII